MYLSSFLCKTTLFANKKKAIQKSSTHPPTWHLGVEQQQL
jgi:hypothetical protein